MSTALIISTAFANQNLHITANNIDKNGVRISVGKIFYPGYPPVGCEPFGSFGYPLLHNGENNISIPSDCIYNGKISLSICSNTQAGINCTIQAALCGGGKGYLYGVPVTKHFGFDGKTFRCTMN